ncbi:MAG: potassium/proton antiporter [Angustibacter sp.]
MSLDELTLSLLVGALVVLMAVAAVRLATASGVPSLLLFLGLGVLIGEAGFGIRFDDIQLTQALGYGALVVILAEGGLTTRWPVVRPVVGPALALATVGVAVSVAVVAVCARYLLDQPWVVALLLGAVVSSTDAAAVFSLLRRVPIHPRLAGLLEAESGLNDAPVVLLVVVLAERAVDPSSAGPLWQVPLVMAAELVGGAVVGGLVGVAGVLVLRWLAPTSSALTALAALALSVGAYALGAGAHTSGFLAVYVASLVLGNAGVPHGAAIRSFAEGLGWLAQIGLFVLLGLLAVPSRLPEQLVPAVLLGGVLLLVARPLSVLVSLAPLRVPWRLQAFSSWAGLRGAVPVVLATVPTTAGVPGTRWLFDLVFVLVVVFTLVQGPTLPWVARRLGVGHEVQERDLDVEVAPLNELHADLLQARIGPTSLLHGLELFELRLPDGANVALVVRDGGAFVPGPRTRLRHGDQLLVVTTAPARRAAQRRLREVSRGGRLAPWTRSAGLGSAGLRSTSDRSGPAARWHGDRES